MEIHNFSIIKNCFAINERFSLIRQQEETKYIIDDRPQDLNIQGDGIIPELIDQVEIIGLQGESNNDVSDSC